MHYFGLYEYVCHTSQYLIGFYGVKSPRRMVLNLISADITIEQQMMKNHKLGKHGNKIAPTVFAFFAVGELKKMHFEFALIRVASARMI
jgi:NADH:ubiquinone oxidoreductase subunit K